MRAFVTGATGFIGTNLVNELIKRDYTVCCLVRSYAKAKHLEDDNIELVQGDLYTTKGLAEQVSKADIVFHVAGVTKALNNSAYFRGNLKTTRHLVNTIRDHAPSHQKIVYISSQAATGPCADFPGIDESVEDCPAVSAYGKSKREAEKEILSISDQFSVVVLRPSIVFGPRDRGMLQIFKTIARGVKIKSGFRVFPVSLIYVDDLVEAILLAGHSADADGGIFYVSDGKQYDWDMLNAAIASNVNPRAVGLSIPLKLIWFASCINGILGRCLGHPQDLNPDKWFEIKQEGWVCSPNRIQTILGFCPKWGLEDGIKATVQWYRGAGWL